ncbi:MAG: diaminopimelate decarboxylase [Bifidobacteriaceae bacterium]|nr:diaminopimelate decarboxylase [Bifidobacteriaceae bacterium]
MALFAKGSAINSHGSLEFYGTSVQDLLEKYGSPLYVVDTDEVRERAQYFVNTATEAFHNTTVHVSYAGKALLTKRLVRIMLETGMHIDTCTMGEMRIALAAGAPGRRLVLHGNNKSYEELELAIREDFDKIVVDEPQEPARIAAIAKRLGTRARVMLRVSAGIHAGGHEFISTAHEDQKFGVALLSPTQNQTVPDFDNVSRETLEVLRTSPALRVLQEILKYPELELVGIHSHIGSNIHDADAFMQAAKRMMALRKTLYCTDAYTLPEVDLGGGYSVAYLEDEDSMDIALELQKLAQSVKETNAQLGMPMPVISFEPGRWIIAPTGCTLYTVGTTKTVQLPDGTYDSKGNLIHQRRYISVDGGMSDNIRPALYGAEYTAVLANRTSESEPVLSRIVGMHCESGDILVHERYLPQDITRGDILAIPLTGAYGRTMASNYNQALFPAVVAVSKQGSSVMLRRQTIEDLLEYDQD